MNYLGIDVGTSGVKVVLLNNKQSCLASASIELKVDNPKPLWSEQNPEDWWRATCKAIDQLKKEKAKDLAEVAAIGLTGQMHGAACIDKNNRPLRPAILWNDGRSFAECEILNKHAADFKAINGNTVMPGFTAPKLLWLQKHEPEVFQQIYKVLLPKDFIRLKLSGDYATDLSDAAGTSWLDVNKRCWSEPLLAATNLTLDHMPKVYEGIEVTGELTTELAQRWGMKKVKIVAGGGDNAAGAISIGIINSERAMLSLGTSGVYFVPTSKFAPDPTKGFHTFCHCIPNTWHQMGVILSAANSLSWWCKVTNQTEEQLLIELVEQKKTQQTPIFLPYLSGERTPHNNPFAQGIFFGITNSTDRAEMTRAVLEGVAFALLDCQNVLRETGTDVEQISVIGGGSRSKLWGQILANVLNKPLSYHNESTLGPAFGAARLAIIAERNKPIEEIAFLPTVIETINPMPSQKKYYQARFAKYREIYHNNKNLFNLGE